jgi:hypothetical protein
MAAGNTKAIVTLALGPGFAERWHAVCEPLWQRYCDRHGYDLICIEEPLDTSARATSRSPAWQKCLVPGAPFAQRYEQVVWVDADILPGPNAPSVVDGVPVELVGAVDEYATPSREVHARVLAKLYRRWKAEGVQFVDNLTADEYYAAFGLPGSFEQVVQTGVMVLSPAHHRELLENTYASYEDKGLGLNYEMRPLSYELLRAEAVSFVDHRFNYIWGMYAALHYPFLITHPDHPNRAEYAAQALADVHFLHFTGSLPEMAAAAAHPPVERRRRRIAKAAAGRLQTPVVLVVHARPDTTAEVVRIVRDARPETLLVVADGPGPGEAERCKEARAVVEEAAWDCEVLTNYADENLGVKRRVETGLDWAFGHVDEAIVLEDDCLPDPSFFGFCDELLARHRDDPRVLSISGNNFGGGADSPEASYYFSRYPLIWGWATWRRAWDLYDPGFEAWPALRGSGWLEEMFDGDLQAVQYWTYIFGQRRKLNDAWDGAWLFASWLAGGLCAVPCRNLVTNVGFRDDATNTRTEFRGLFSDVPAVPIELPLLHPARVERDVEADAFLEDVMFSGNVGRLLGRIRTLRPVAR